LNSVDLFPMKMNRYLADQGSNPGSDG